MTHEHGKSAPAVSSREADEQGRASGCGAGRAKGGDRGEYGSAQHAPGTGPGKRVPSAGPHTASRKAKEEGTVHLAPPPCRHRPAPAGVLRAQAKRRSRRGLTWRDYEADLEPKLED